jgi:hypothetical protein
MYDEANSNVLDLLEDNATHNLLTTAGKHCHRLASRLPGREPTPNKLFDTILM